MSTNNISQGRFCKALQSNNKLTWSPSVISNTFGERPKKKRVAWQEKGVKAMIENWRTRFVATLARSHIKDLKESNKEKKQKNNMAFGC